MLKAVGTSPRPGLELGRWQRENTVLTGAGGKYGHDARWSAAAPTPGWTYAMTVRVLVVDDEPDVEPLFRQQFRREVREGLYLLDFAPSGETALDMLDGCVGEDFILVVSDINMPGMNGLDLLPKVKERRPGLPVFVISAYGDATTVTVALERGADQFLTKPVDFPRLRRGIMAVQADAMRRNA